MGIDPPALSRLETGKVLNPTLATLHKWAEGLITLLPETPSTQESPLCPRRAVLFQSPGAE